MGGVALEVTDLRTDRPQPQHGLRVLRPADIKRAAVVGSAEELGPAESGGALREILALLNTLRPEAAAESRMFGFDEAADFAGTVEEISRTVEFLQIVAARAVERTREEARTGVFDAADDGYRNAAEFLRCRLRIGIGEARRRLALASTLLPGTGMAGQDVPALNESVGAAVASAQLSSRSATVINVALEQVRHVADESTLRHMEQALTDTAKQSDPDFVARVARRWCDAIDQDGHEPTEEELRHRQGAFLRRPRRGLQHVEIFATPEQFETLATVMNAAANPRLQCASENPDVPENHDAGPRVSLDRRSRPQKLLDGLVGACGIALASGQLPTNGGLRPQVLVTIDYRDLLSKIGGRFGTGGGPGGQDCTGYQGGTGYQGHTGDQGGTGYQGHTGDQGGTGYQGRTGRQRAAGGIASTSNSGSSTFQGPIPPEVVRKIACDADIIPVVLGGESRVLDIGRTSRIFPPHIRKAITARDQGCAFPECTMPAPWCEAHHIDYWSHGGTTGVDNGTLLCSHHHHVVHKERWKIRVASGVPWFIPPPHLDPGQTPRRNQFFRPSRT